MRQSRKETSRSQSRDPTPARYAAGARWKRAVAITVVLAAVTAAAYWRLGNNDFVILDDNQYITGCYEVNQGLTRGGIKWAFTTFRNCNWHPLTWLSHMADVELFGMWAPGHHLVNLVYHILNTLLLFWFLAWTTGRHWPGAFVAALFALHPAHVESVAWAAERKDVLSTLFWMATMLAYVFYARRPGVLRYVLVLALLALGLMAKPMLVTLPLVLLLLDYWPLERFELTRTGLRRAPRLILEKLPLLALSLVSSLITLQAQSEALYGLSLTTRTLNAVVSYGRYILKMIWPVNLAVYYPYLHQSITVWAIPAAALLVITTLCSLWLGVRRRYILVGWFWYLITLVPVIGLIQVGGQSYADRYTYIPFTGLFIIIAWAVADLVAKRPGLKLVFTTAALVIIAALGTLTYRTVRYWKSDFTLFTRALTVTRDNFFIHMKLGEAYCNDNQLDKAYTQLTESLRIQPHCATYDFLGTVMRKKGLYAEALEYYNKALEAEPGMSSARLNAGLLLHNMGRYAEAEQQFRKAIDLIPDWADAHGNLGMTLSEMGRLDEALTECATAVRLQPQLASAHRALASTLAKKGDYKQAAAEYRISLTIESEFSAWNNLGDALEHLGELAEAEKCYRQAIALKPHIAIPYYNLGVVLKMMNRNDEAALALKGALAIDPDYEDAKRVYRELTGGTQ